MGTAKSASGDPSKPQLAGMLRVIQRHAACDSVMLRVTQCHAACDTVLCCV
jgi:hypothetical protein